MPLLGGLHRVGATVPDRLEPAAVGRLFDGTAAGNLAVYLDVAPVLLAYKSGGIEAVRTTAPGSNRTVIGAMETLDRGDRTDSPLLILRGNQGFVTAELTLLQQVTFGPQAETWARLTPAFGALAASGCCPTPPCPVTTPRRRQLRCPRGTPSLARGEEGPGA